MSLPKLFPGAGLAAFVMLVFYFGCQDLGDDIPPGPRITRIIPQADSIGREVKIEGEHFGADRGNSYVRFGTIQASQYSRWQDDEINVIVPAGAVSGSVVVVVGGRESNGIGFTVLSTAFGIVEAHLSFTVGEDTVLAIAGGIGPYSLESRGDTTVARNSIAGASLTVQALAPGTSTIVVGDASTPRQLDTLHVVVNPLVSFGTQIQPIFTNRCANQGCHPGGGAPFSLAVGQSYGQLVGVAAARSCTGATLRVQGGSADGSVLMRRLDGTSCGAQMPLGLTPLPQNELDLIRTWILQGAQNN